MKCPVTGQPCKKKKTYQVTNVVENQATNTIYVCEDCVKTIVGFEKIVNESMAQEKKSPPPDVVTGLLEFISKIMGAANEKPSIEQKMCPKCGSTPATIEKTGKFGCDYCYQVFDLDSLLMNLHGATKHVGKVPKKWKSQQEQQERDAKLQDIENKVQKKLKEAIQKEQYEVASIIQGLLTELSNTKKQTEELGMRVKETIEKGKLVEADQLQKELQAALHHYFEIQESMLSYM